MMEMKGCYDIVEHGEAAEQPVLPGTFAQVRAARAPVCRHADEIDTLEDDPAGIWLSDPTHQVEQRRFAGTVGANDRKHRATRNIERNVANRLHSAKSLAQPFGAKRKFPDTAG